MSNVLTILNDLDATSGNDKIRLLETHKDNELVKKIFYYGLSDRFQYYIKIIPPYFSQEKATLTLEDFIAELHLFSERKLTGHAAINKLAQLLEQLSPDDAIVAGRIISRDLRCGVAASTCNKVWKNLIPKYPCLLGKAYDEKTSKNITYPAYSQIKSDGMRINAFVFFGDTVSITLRGRSGKTVNIHGYLDVSLQAYAMNKPDTNFVLDGELVVVDKFGKILPRKIGNGILNKAIKGTISDEEASRVRMNVWDIIPYDDFNNAKCNTPYSKRFAEVENLTMLSKLNGNTKIELIESKIVNNIEEAQEHFADALNRGEEGTMLKTSDHIWEDKRSKYVLKFKAEKDVDLVVLDWQEGTGKYAGKCGALICGTECGGLVVSVGSGFSDKQREEFTTDMIGEVVTIKYNEVISTDGSNVLSLFLPRFIEHRLDKSEPNKLEEIK